MKDAIVRITASFEGLARSAGRAARALRNFQEAWDRRVCRDLGVKYSRKRRRLKKYRRRWAELHGDLGAAGA